MSSTPAQEPPAQESPAQEPPAQESPAQEPPAQELSSGSDQTLPSRPFLPMPDPSASKRVCFYKSGDNKFSGHRMVINARTFKTFDALLDALSKKVPLPFGVRTITTPRGIHLVRALDDLHDGGSYVCSDQKRVKPLNLDEVNRRQVPWNTTRPFSVGRRKRPALQFGRRNEVNNRPSKITERVAVRTPKKLLVINNRDPTVKRTIVLQRRTAPTFDSLLDYLSQILQFPVLKLFSTDGRRVDGLAALILCSGVVVAAGNEPFKLGSYSFHRTGQMAQVMYMDTVETTTLQPIAQNNKSFSSGRGSRNFSVSSERYIVDQVNKSRNGSTNHHNSSLETDVKHRRTPRGTHGTHGRALNEHRSFTVPHEDDIEKSFRVNQDGSMTVEMKVHLTVKEEELLHWTTTLSRSSLSRRTVCASVSESCNSSPDSNNAKDSSCISGDEMKEENRSAGAAKGVGFNEERAYEGYASTPLGKAKAALRRLPTPGPRQVNKKASVESVKMVTESGVQESTMGHYSYMERTAGGETTEGYCVVRHSSSSSRPIPKPRKTLSAGASKQGSHSSIISSGVAEVLQIQNNGMGVTETVMHIYESQGCYDNYFANEEYSADGLPGSVPAPQSQPSTIAGSRSSSNDCDIDFSNADLLQRQKEEMLSLSSEPIANHLSSSAAENEARTATNSQMQRAAKRDKPKSGKTKTPTNPARNQKSSTSTSSSDKKQKESIVSPSKHSKNPSPVTSKAGMGKKSQSSSESVRSGQRSRGAEKPATKKGSKTEKIERKKAQPPLANAENAKKTPPQRQNINKTASRYNGHNVNTPTTRPTMKKNISDILKPKKSLFPVKKTISVPKSMNEGRVPSPKKSQEVPESFSMPSLNPSPADIHKYVENWLEKVNVNAAPCGEDAVAAEPESRPKVVFQMGADSDSDEKNECQNNLDEDRPASPSGAVKKSASFLSVPLDHAPPATALLQDTRFARGLCASMPSVRDAVPPENRLRGHKSAEAISPADNDSSSSMLNMLSPKMRIKPVLQQLYSSMQCIRNVSDANMVPDLKKSSSTPDFSSQVASVFGSSCKAFLSFLSVMTLRDNLTAEQTQSTSEAMLMMESLQKISAIDDEAAQKASLTNLQSTASAQLRDRWKDFQILRERLESEPLSPKFSETEFALDVISEAGDVFEDQHMVIDELMDELNMPQDLREEICSTIQQAKSFYPVEESTFMEAERNESDSEEDVEKFVDECDDETKESDAPCVDEQAKMLAESQQELNKVQETGGDVIGSETSQAERDEEGEEEREGVKDRRSKVTKEIDDDAETEMGERESEEEAEENMDDNEEEQQEAGKGSEEEDETAEKVEEQMTVDEEEEEEGLVDEDDREAREDDSVEDTDEREGVEETEEEGKGEGEADEEEKGEEGGTEVGKWGEFGEEETGNDIEETNEGDEENNTNENVGEEEEEEGEEESDVLTDDAEEEAEEAEEGIEESEGITKVNKEKDEEEERAEMQEEDREEEEEEAQDTEEEEEEGEESAPLTYDAEEEAEEGIEENEEITTVNKEKEEEQGAEMEEEEEEEREEEEAAEDAEEEEEEEREEEEAAEDAEEEEEGEEESDPLTYDAEEEAEEGIEEPEKITKVNKLNDEEEGGEMEEEEEDDEREEEAADDAEEEGVREKEEIIEGIEEEEEEEENKEEETGQIMEKHSKQDADEKDEDEGKAVSEEEEEEREQEEEQEEAEDGEEVRNDGETEEEEEEEREEADTNIEEEEKCDEGEREEDVVEEGEGEDNTEAEQTLDEEEGGDDEDDEEVNEGSEQTEVGEWKDEGEEGNVSDDSAADRGRNASLEEASYLQQQSSSGEEANGGGECVDDKGNGTDATDEGAELHEERRGSLPHPVEISQELLDFVNSALQSSSLVFTYDTQGNVRLQPDSAVVVQTKHAVIPKRREDSSYGRKHLQSPGTSDLSDYRPETSESGGYKTQDSVDVVTESGDEASQKPFPVCRRKTKNTPHGRTPTDSKLSAGSQSEALQNSKTLKSGGSFSSLDSATKASKEDLSYFSAGSSQRAEVDPPAEHKDPTDGVLIDQGRWLLKENHLIRKSPPVSLGMYGNADSTSIDTSHENNSDDSQTHNKIQPSPLVAISSSELEEMAKPQTPKCTYYNMSHGSDSDPFLDDSSFKNGKKDTGSAKGRGFRVSPTVDTSKTWTNKNGSLSSFTSVEFKIPDRKVHPEGESPAVSRARRTSSGGRSVVQAQNSLETLRVRCGQYCPIL